MTKNVITGVILALAIFGGVIYFTKSNNQTNLPAGEEIIYYKAPNMSDESKADFEKKLEERKNLVLGISADTKDNQKYMLYMDLANAYYTLGYLKEAKENYEKALGIFSNEANALHMYSINLAAMNDKVGALDAARKAVQLFPTEPDPWNWLITLEQKFNNADFNTINDLYVQALDKTGMYHDILVAYALYLEENGKYDLAINYWEKAIEKNPSKKSEYQENIRKLEEKKELSK